METDLVIFEMEYGCRGGNCNGPGIIKTYWSFKLKDQHPKPPAHSDSQPPPLPRLKPKTIRMSKIFKKIESVIIDKMIMLI